jgi:hypothetical protein
MRDYTGANLGNTLKWRGGTHTGANNGKPHQDILLNNMFGIQIKNTTKDIAEIKDIGRIDFTEAKLETMMTKVGISYGTVR